MYTVRREVLFSYGHRLLSYEGKCARLHGHNGRLVVTLAAEKLDPAGMVVDFVEIKNAIVRWIEETLDHRMVLSHEDPAVAALEAIREPIYVVDFNPTAENLARHLFERLREEGLPVIEVALEETPNCAATYRPTG
jgi:6-pyruvoyltetrahydropterin/6-carboxytetrahydropterin synthase